MAPTMPCDKENIPNGMAYVTKIEDDDPHGTESGTGWDLTFAEFIVDPWSNSLSITLRCLGVCGDADEDGNPDSASKFPDSIAHVDYPQLGGSERMFCRFESTGNDEYQWWAGVIDNDNAKDNGIGSFHIGYGDVAIQANSFKGPNQPTITNTHFPTIGEPFLSYTIANLDQAPGWTGWGHIEFVCQAGSNKDYVGEDDLRGSIVCDENQLVGHADGPACAGRCEHGQAVYDHNTNSNCWCRADCIQYNDCCADYQQTCADDFVDITAAPGQSVCVGLCESQDVFTENGAICYCDRMCMQYNDCCSGYQQTCLGTDLGNMCAGRCGQEGAIQYGSDTCHCDAQCKNYNDCCPGFDSC